MMNEHEKMAKAVWGFCAWTAVLTLLLLVSLWNVVAARMLETWELSGANGELPLLLQPFLTGFPVTLLLPAVPFLWLSSAQFMSASSNHLRILTVMTFALNLLFLGCCGLSFATIMLRFSGAE